MLAAALLASAVLATSLPPMEPAGQWEAFRSRFVTPAGRIRDTGNEGISHSEGQAYAMLIAATLGERDDFDRIWAWTQQNLQVRPDGLLAWRWDPAREEVTDTNNASDGDLVAAWALVRAARRWPTGGYQREAARLLDTIEARLVRGSRLGPVLMPGAEGFEPDEGLVVNPSYWVFPAFEEIALARPTGPWRRLARTGRELLQTARFGSHDLPADWVLISAEVAPAPNHPPRFGYDAVRVPLYACWSTYRPVPAARAIDGAWQGPRPPAWIDLETGEQADWTLGEGGLAVRALLARCLGRDAPMPAPAAGTDYYDAVLSLLATLAAREAAP